MKPCTAFQYLAHGFFPASLEQIRIVMKLEIYAVRASVYADFGRAEKAADFAEVAAALAFLAFPDLRPGKPALSATGFVEEVA